MGCWGDIAGPTFPPRFEKMVGRFSLFKHGEAFVQFYRRRVIEAVGAFDTDFGPGPQSKYPCGGDDSDYLLRAALAGFEIRRVSEIHIAHPMQNVEGFSADKIVGYGVTRMKLLGAVNAARLDLVLTNREGWDLLSRSGYLLELGPLLEEAGPALAARLRPCLR